MTIGTKVLALSATALLGASGVPACTSDDGGDTDHRQHQEEVAQRGSEVMPFDLDATTHTYSTRTLRASSSGWSPMIPRTARRSGSSAST
jgi:hypothetical protein